MGRGPSLKTELKKLKKNLETKFKTKLKLYQKYPQVWIGDRLADILKKTGVTDIAKIIAIVGMTVLVKKIIDETEELREFLLSLGLGPRFRIGPVNPFARINPVLAKAFGDAGDNAKDYEGFFPDWIDWLIAFSLAYVIIEHGGQIMQGVGNMTASIKDMLFGLLLGGGKAS